MATQDLRPFTAAPDANGVFRGAALSVTLSSKLEVAGFQPFVTQAEVRATVGKDGKILFDATQPVGITRNENNPIIKFLNERLEDIRTRGLPLSPESIP